MRKITSIVIHCSAGHSNSDSVQKYFLRPKSQGGRGWRVGGYHIIIDKDGTINQKYPFSQITNGVVGFNSNTIHICYVGGVDKNNVNKAIDTRTPEQKESIIKAIKMAQKWLKDAGQDVKKVVIKGHRDFSPDKNGNGIIEPWERIKECPSFDAIPEYKQL